MSTIDVVAAVVRRGDYYLICQRPQAKAHGGLWEFPGGKVHDGETCEQALSRELFEELGMQAIKIGTELYQGSEPGSCYQIRFFAVYSEEEPELREHSQLAWCHFHDLTKYALAPIDREFVIFMEKADGNSLRGR